jgi:hypothetical protein
MSENSYHVVCKTRGGTVSIVRNINLAQAKALRDKLLPPDRTQYWPIRHDSVVVRSTGQVVTTSGFTIHNLGQVRVSDITDADIVEAWVLGPEGFEDAQTTPLGNVPDSLNHLS